MKLKIIAVGKIKGPSILALVNGYSKKISYDAKIEILEIKDSDEKEEGKKIIELLEKSKDNVFFIAMSEEGKQLTSREFSDKLKQQDLAGKAIIFAIGGPFGLSQEVKSKADLVLSLSKMTFTHEMARLFLEEQVYRALSIINNRKYHKD